MVFASLIDPGSRGAPDGMRVDKHGRLFVSGPNGIWIFNRGGEHIGTVQMPHSMANLAWGGLDYSKLYITAGKTVYILQTNTHGFVSYENKSRTSPEITAQMPSLSRVRVASAAMPSC
jgi:gluconolactonase